MIKFELKKIEKGGMPAISFKIYEQDLKLKEILPFHMEYNGNLLVTIDSCENPQLSVQDEKYIYVRGEIPTYHSLLCTEVFIEKEKRDMAYDIILLAFKKLSEKWTKLK